MNRRSIVHIALMAAAYVAISAPGQAAYAADSILAEIRVIAASQGGSKYMDPKLGDVRGTLGVTFAGYTSFKQLSLQQLTFDKGDTEKVSLPQGSVMSLTFNGMSGSMASMKMSVARRSGQVKTLLRPSLNTWLFFALSTGGKETIILGISVKKR